MERATLPAADIPPEAIIFWVIFDHPNDVPDAAFVLRPQFAVMDAAEPERYGTVTQRIARTSVVVSNHLWKAPTLDAARALVPEGCWPMGRYAADDPKVVEVWMQ